MYQVEWLQTALNQLAAIIIIIITILRVWLFHKRNS